MTTSYLSSASNPGLQGHYAGVVTRAVSFGIDILLIVGGFALGGTVAEYVLSALFGGDVRLAEAPLVSALLLAAWAVFYMAYPLSVAGRTLGMGIVGVRAVRADGRDLDQRHAVVRVLVLPLSFLLFCFGFVLIVLRRDRRALHDLIAGTVVVYAWDARAARLRFLLKR
ncbi:MAG: RDD family protein [Ilumatobacteraceae bacterium]